VNTPLIGQITLREYTKMAINRDQILIGSKVKIILKNRKDFVDGVVAEILTGANSHPHGIMVKLKDGEIGRVRELVGSIKPKSEIANELSFNDIITGGENYLVEYKASILWSKNYNADDVKLSKSREVKEFGSKASRIIIAKTIISFMNSNGGNLIIGVMEDKNNEVDEIVGIDKDFEQLKKGNQHLDGYRRMIVDDVIRPYFPSSISNHLNNYLDITFEKKDDKYLCWIKISKSDRKVFLKINNKDYFFIRVDAESRELKGEEMVDYCSRRF
jgi:uncharacterized repeat protein (TIGR03833 family)